MSGTAGSRARTGAAAALGVVLSLATGCAAEGASPRSASAWATAAPETVPVATVLNEIKCDYLDFAYSDFARARRLPVGRISGQVTLSVSRYGTATIGVPVAPGPLYGDAAARGAALPPETLTVPFAMDPQLALDPAAAKLDCAPGARLGRPVLELTALAGAIAPAQSGGPYLKIASPLRYQGAFYLLRDAASGRTDVVPVRGDAARLGRDAMYLHTFDITIETGGASWFADVGPATAEPRPAAPDRATPRRRVRVPAAPVAGRPAAPVKPAPQVAQRERRCVGSSGADMVCY